MLYLPNTSLRIKREKHNYVLKANRRLSIQKLKKILLRTFQGKLDPKPKWLLQ